MHFALEDYNYLSQIAASIAVVISVLVLARQVRENTIALKVNANKDASLGWSEFNAMLSQHRDHVAFSKTFSPSAALADFSDAEQQSLFYLGRAMMQRFESEYFQISAGIMNAEEWQAHRRWCASFLRYPVWATWWNNESKQILYTQSFLDNIASAEIIPVTAGGIIRASDITTL